MRDSGLIKFRGEGGDFKLKLTNKARKFLEKLNFRTIQVGKQKTWDKKWWLIVADIPTKEHRLGADQFRKKLKDMGFYFLQRTVWFYPFDPRKEIQFISETYGIQKFITVMEVSRLDVEDERRMKQFFKL